jgi:hypothetical protein
MKQDFTSFKCQDFLVALELSSPKCVLSDSNSVQKRSKLFDSYLALFPEVFSLLSYSFALHNLPHNPHCSFPLTGWPRGSLVRIF